MAELRIETYINEALTGEAKSNALDFTAFLRANDMLFVRGTGYWEDKHYWMIKYKDEDVCFILINGSYDEAEFAPWTIWSDDSDSNWFMDVTLDEQSNDTVWKYVDLCGNCGGCDIQGGTTKSIFRKEFSHVCRTTLRFINPDIEVLECVKKVIGVRKNDISRRRP